MMCQIGATCLHADCCFSELALYKSNSVCWSRTKRTSSSSSHWKWTCSRHDIAENIAELALKTITHSLTHTYITVLLWRHEPVVYAKHHTVILQSKLFFLDNKEALKKALLVVKLKWSLRKLYVCHIFNSYRRPWRCFVFRIYNPVLLSSVMTNQQIASTS